MKMKHCARTELAVLQTKEGFGWSLKEDSLKSKFLAKAEIHAECMKEASCNWSCEES